MPAKNVYIFLPRPQAPAPIFVVGVTKNSLGVPLAGVTVDLFHSDSDVKVATVISDGSGNFSFSVGIGEAYYAVAYLAGSPDMAGTTRNNLAGGGSSVNLYLKDPTSAGGGSGYSRSRVANMVG